MGNTSNKFSPEVRSRAVRQVLGHEHEHTSRWSAIVSVSSQIGCAAQTLHEWLGTVGRDSGLKQGLTTDMATKNASFLLDALGQALHERRPASGGGGHFMHHSDRGSQYVGIRYTECLAEARIEPSAGSVGDSHDNALAETINGPFKAEGTHRCGPWRCHEAVEFATFERVDWFNNRRLLEPIGNIQPAKAEELYYVTLDGQNLTACLEPNGLRQTRDGSHLADSTSRP